MTPTTSSAPARFRPTMTDFSRFHPHTLECWDRLARATTASHPELHERAISLVESLFRDSALIVHPFVEIHPSASFVNVCGTAPFDPAAGINAIMAFALNRIKHGMSAVAITREAQFGRVGDARAHNHFGYELRTISTSTACLSTRWMVESTAARSNAPLRVVRWVRGFNPRTQGLCAIRRKLLRKNFYPSA